MADAAKDRLLERINSLVEENRRLRVTAAEYAEVILAWEEWAKEAQGVLAGENRRVGELESAMIRAIGLLRAAAGA